MRQTRLPLLVLFLAWSTIPVLAGTHRAIQILFGERSVENIRFFEAPVSTLLHVVSSALFVVLGAFLLAHDVSKPLPSWHRSVGKLVLPNGLVAATTGLWMTLTFPHVSGDGAALFVTRIVVGVSMTYCLVMGLVLIQRRERRAHRAWMVRGYALGLGAGTQAVLHLPLLVLGITAGETLRSWLMGLGWAINLAIAEATLRREKPQTHAEMRLQTYSDLHTPPASQSS